MLPALPTRLRLLGLAVLGNFGGAGLSFLYFHEVDPATGHGIAIGGAELAFFVLSFALLFAAGRLLSRRWMRPLTGGAVPPPADAAGDKARRRAVLTPAFIAVLTLLGWLAAGLVWGVLWPLLVGGLTLENALRQLFGIAFVGGTLVATTMFFGMERIWRAELPRILPAGDLSAVRAPRVRTRMLAALLLVSLMPMAVLSAAALMRAHACCRPMQRPRPASSAS